MTTLAPPQPEADGAVLTIAIPTYNRNDSLAANLALLLPQLSARCRLLVVDNCSPQPVAETIAPLLAGHPNVQCRLVRNEVNIGGNANVLRCIELCETPWIWVLGDDDEMTPTAVETILNEVAAHSECLLVNFSSDGLRTRSWQATGLRSLLHNLDKSADLPWISSSVYSSTVLRPLLKFGFQHCYSLLPHMALLLVAQGEEGRSWFSQQQIVARPNGPAAATEQQWSIVNLALGFPTLLDLPLPPEMRKLVMTKLMLTNHSNGINLRALTYQLLLLGLRSGDHRSSVYYYDQVCARAFYFSSPLQKARLRFFRVLVRFPKLASAGFKLLRGRAIGDLNFQDRYERV